MLTLLAHAFPGRLDTLEPSHQKNESISPTQISARTDPGASAIRGKTFDCDFNNEVFIQQQSIVFVVLDLHSQFNSNAIVAFRTINNDVYVFTDFSACHHFIQSCEEKIFFICTSKEKSLIEEYHQFKSIEAMFILTNTEAQLDIHLPKLFNVYTHCEELLIGLKETLDWYEQIQMEIFVFEDDRLFLWLQLWKDEFLKTQKLKESNDKTRLVQVAEDYYRGNAKMLLSINDFDENHTKQDVFQWCFSSPFPSRFLHRALSSHDIEQLSFCEYLLADLSQKIQSNGQRSNCELYKGMKITKEYLDRFEDHINKLICVEGFFQCVLSRKQALTDATSPDHRPDLIPVLFKISYDGTVPLVDVVTRNNQWYIISNVYTVFRVKYVNRGPMTRIRIEVADEDGKNIARDYRRNRQTDNVQHLLNQLIRPRQRPAKPVKRSVSVLPPIQSNEDIEMLAEELLRRGKTTQAIGLYEKVKPMTGRICEIIATIYAKKLGNFRLSIEYLKKALVLKEKNGENVLSILTQLGIAYQCTRKYHSALHYHSQAFQICQKMPMKDPVLLAACLIGMANAYWGEKNSSQALQHARQALILNESVERGNDTNISVNLAILANIYHTCGDVRTAIEMNERGLALAERNKPTDELVLATMRNNIGTMQISVGLFAEGRKNYAKSLEIYRRLLPESHPKRRVLEQNIQRIDQIEKMQTH